MEDLEREPEPTEVPERYFKEYLAGNARFPTFAFPFAVLIANNALFDEKFDPVSLALSELNEDQLKELRRKVAHQHAQNAVPYAPAGYEELVKKGIVQKAREEGRELKLEDVHVKTTKDDTLQRMWHTHVNHAIGIIGALSGIRKHPEDEIFYSPFVYKASNIDRIVDDEKLMSLATEVAWRLQDEGVRMEVQNVLRSFAKVLNGPYGDKKSDEIRAVKDTRRGRPLNEALFKAMITQYRLDMDSDMALGLKRRVLTDREIKAFKSRFLHP